jgi:hypothetical protein
LKKKISGVDLKIPTSLGCNLLRKGGGRREEGGGRREGKSFNFFQKFTSVVFSIWSFKV